MEEQEYVFISIMYVFMVWLTIADALPHINLHPCQSTHRESIKTHRDKCKLSGMEDRRNEEQGHEKLCGPSVEEFKQRSKEPRPPSPQGQILIEELRSDTLASYEETDKGKLLYIPEHSVTLIKGGYQTEGKDGIGEGKDGGGEAQGELVKVTVKLPGVQKLKEIDLEVSEVS